MSSIILHGDIVCCGCDRVVVGPTGNYIAMIGGQPDGVYPHEQDYAVVDNVILPDPWSPWGYTYQNGEFIPNPSVPPTPTQPISNRQFYQQLAVLGAITEDEAISAVGGVVPGSFENFIKSLPANERFAAAVFLSGATIYQRDDAVVAQLGVYMGWDAQYMNDLWTEAAKL